MQICFDDEDDDEGVDYGQEERSDIIEEEYVQKEEEDEDVDRLFVNTDEKINNSPDYFKGGDGITQTLDSSSTVHGLGVVSLGPNLNMQVNAIGSLRRRKRAADKK
jgi:hypothetical protein